MSSVDRPFALNQARAALRAGRLAQTREWCEQLLAANAADPDALNLIGSAAMQQGALDEAERYYQRAVDACPREPGLLINLGKLRLQKGSAEEAVATFDKALALNPRMDMALAGKAEALNYLGDPGQAQSLLEPAVRAGHDGPESAFVYATVLAQAGQHQAVIDVVARHFNDPGVPGFHRYRLGLLLGKSHESLGEYAKAFEAYSQANAASGAAVSFSPDQRAAYVDKLIDFFTRQRLHSLPHAANDSRLPVFIAGMARSGTTLIEQIIQSHPQAHGGGELTLLDQAIAALARQPGGYPASLATITPDIATNLARTYTDRLQSLNPAALRIVDKSLRNIEHIGLISLLFPKARIIHCRRDPLDTCLSCFLSPLSPIKHAYSTNLNHLGLFHRQYERLMDHWLSTVDTPVLQVRYEDLVADQETVSRKMIEFCGLDWDDRCLRYHESRRVVKTLSFDQVRRPIYDKSIGRHRNYEQFLGPLREGLQGRIAT